MTEESSEQTGPERDPTDPGTPGSGAEEVPGSDPPQTEEEVRARIEEQIRNLRVQDLMVESVVSVLNLTARRIAKEDERDLDQARIGIDAVKAWVDLLPDEAATQIRNALSELQMLYAAAVEGGGTGQSGPGSEKTGAEQTATDRGTPGSGAEDVPRSGEPPPRIWTPPGSK
jgi:multidrug efflux pump subunit AcrB